MEESELSAASLDFGVTAAVASPWPARTETAQETDDDAVTNSHKHNRAESIPQRSCVHHTRASASISDGLSGGSKLTL